MSKKLKDWKTAVTKVEPNNIMVHGYPINELMGEISYADGLCLMLKGELPDRKLGKMMDTILVSSMDHGVTPPSTLAALTCVSTGGNLNQALACGILSINQHHGGAIQNCQKVLLSAVKLKEDNDLTIETAAEEVVKDAIANKVRLPGFGHRIHTNDPRAVKLYEAAKNLGFYGDYPKMMKAMESAFEKIKGKKLPINVDGAIASLLCEMGFDPELGNAFFMIARMPGLLTHIVEERDRQKPMRRINPLDYEYDGPGQRKLG
ncbi:MAG: citryl-CoA lyase [Candidatus Eremiobacteraeota bacterium]|nr:citryl-CoA lyase [Candidatus Eremiobacteraeota bacterium]